MNALYIGDYSEGSTSRMRAMVLQKLLKQYSFDIIDISIPKKKLSRIWQSIGFRFKVGPVVTKINSYIKENLKKDSYDLIWVDKAIYLTLETTLILREKTSSLIHYTPDPAFSFHKSHHFDKSVGYYDYVVTTKSYELAEYTKRLEKSKIIFVHQSFDKNLHKPVHTFNQKYGVSFIGHYEKERAKTIKLLIENGIHVKLAGINWRQFAKKYEQSPFLNYMGDGLFGEDYVRVISSSLVAWGSISKWIPEKHTTRTFEIPACKTALLTEENDEIRTYFTEEEVIFYNNDEELLSKVQFYMHNVAKLEKLINLGYSKVQSSGYDNEAVIKKILIKICVM